MCKISLVLFNDIFTDTYHLYLIFIMVVIDDVCAYLLVQHIVRFFNSLYWIHLI